ncbi:MAG: phage tail tube protein [Pseudomonadota bacterium]
MSEPSSFNGSKIAIKIGDGADPEVFTHPCLINATRGLQFSSSTIDSVIPDCDDLDAPAWVAREKDSLAVTITGEGIMDAQSTGDYFDWLLQDDPKNVQGIVDLGGPDEQTFEGTFHLTDFQVSGERKEKAQVSITLISTGAILREGDAAPSPPPPPPPAPDTEPGAVQNMSATPGDGQLDVSWAAPASDGGSAITDYLVGYRLSSVGGAFTTWSENVSPVTGAVITGLTNGEAYDIEVSAVNSVGIGTATVLPDELVGGASGPSISLSAPDFGGSTYYEGVDDNDITVTISNFEPSTAYTISVSSDGGGTPPANATGTTDGNGGASAVMNITGLNAGLVTFTATVGSDVKTRSATLAARAAPTISTVSAVAGTAQNTISWSSLTPNGAAISSRTLEADDGSGYTSIYTPSGDGEDSYVHDDLIIGKEYTYRLSATNSQGTTQSNTPSETPSGTVHVYLMVGQSNMVGQPAFDGGSDYATNVYEWIRSITNDYRLADSPLAGQGGGMSIGITFSESALAAEGAPDAIALIQAGAGSTSFSGNNWNKGDTEYEVAVAAANLAITNYPGHEFKGILWHQGEGDWSAMTDAEYQAAQDQMIADMRADITAASSTTPFVVGEISDDSYALSRRQVITSTPDRVGYTGAVTTNDLSTYDNVHFDAASLRTMGTRYWNAVGEAILNIPEVPEAPDAPSLTAGNAQVTASWTAPASKGSSITDYTIQYRVSPSGTPVTVTDAVDATTSEIITGLTNGTAYQVRVAATNSTGTGDYSDWSDAATPSAASAESLALTALGNATIAYAFDWSDASTLTVETDGTGGEPGNGDLIGRITEKVNDTNIAASADGARPTYRTADGGYCESTGGTTDVPVTTAALTSNMTIYSVFRTSDTQGMIIGEDNSTGSAWVRNWNDGNSSSSTSNSGTPTGEVNDSVPASTNRDGYHDAIVTGSFVKTKETGADMSGYGAFNEFKHQFGGLDTGKDVVLTVVYDATGMSAGDETAIEDWVDEVFNAL